MEYRKQLQSLFPDPDFDQLYGFSALHKAVVGLGGYQLQNVINDQNTDINIADFMGWTSLHWAAQRGDVSTLETLIAHGADCDRLDNRGLTALGAASRTSIRCVDFLLSANADVRATRHISFTALHYAAGISGNLVEQLEIVQSLVHAGADIDALDEWNESPLTHTLGLKNLTVVGYLLEAGADIDIIDVGGNNALSFAAQYNFHSTIGLLLNKGADHVSKINRFCTFMHLVAEHADTQTLRLLARGSLKRRDINVKNQDKLIPMQLSWQREGLDAEWKEAFMEFLISIDQDYWHHEEPQEVESEGEGAGSRADNHDSDGDFEDALQFQPGLAGTIHAVERDG